MIAARQFQDFGRGLGRNAFDLPVAVLAGLAVAFAVFAMPADVFSQIVNATGFPNFLSAAEPPLGFKARAGIGVAGALAVFGLVLLLLRRLDNKGAARANSAPATDEDMPRLRRRDVHPDAPVRRPISAARDLGEPAPPPVAPAARAPIPVWLAGADVVEVEPEPEPAPAPEPKAEASLADLMARLERGLARRRTRRVFAPASQPPQVFPEANDDRLQSAIEGLQRLAARGD